jgi:fatty-acid desaturase
VPRLALCPQHCIVLHCTFVTTVPPCACPRRYHHLHCDTPLDLHSPYEGFYHAHMGWLFRGADVERPLLDRTNVKDLAQHSFYRWLEHTWVAHVLGRFFFTWVSAGRSAKSLVQVDPVAHPA